MSVVFLSKKSFDDVLDIIDRGQKVWERLQEEQEEREDEEAKYYKYHCGIIENPDNVETYISQTLSDNFDWMKDRLMSVTKFRPGCQSLLEPPKLLSLEDQCLLTLAQQGESIEVDEAAPCLPQYLLRRLAIMKREAVDLHLLGINFQLGRGREELCGLVKKMHANMLVDVVYLSDMVQRFGAADGMRVFIGGRELLENGLDVVTDPWGSGDTDDEDYGRSPTDSEDYEDDGVTPKKPRRERRFDRVIRIFTKEKLAREAEAKDGGADPGDEVITLYKSDTVAKNVYICMKRGDLLKKIAHYDIETDDDDDDV
jgi:hypothetical protein